MTTGPRDYTSGTRAALAALSNGTCYYPGCTTPILTFIDGEPFTATVASTGTVVSVAADETLLAALRRAGVAAPYSCQQGFCGTCRTRVLDGVVQHRDTLLTTPERDGGMMLTCVSRAPAGEKLTVDL